MNPSDFDEIMRFQRTVAQDVAQEQQQENKIELMSIINELVDERGIAQKEAINIEAQNQGFTGEQIQDLLDDLESDHFLIQKSGYVKKV